MVQEFDVVLDCTDNPAARYLLNDVCVVLRRPLVSAAAVSAEGGGSLFRLCRFALLCHTRALPHSCSATPVWRTSVPECPPFFYPPVSARRASGWYAVPWFERASGACGLLATIRRAAVGV